jgi:transcriptional regulator of arginine metabolism
MSKKKDALIRNLINANKLKKQSEVVKLLQDNDLNITQSSISRTFKRLGIVKRGDKKSGFFYIIDDQPTQLNNCNWLSNLVRSIDNNGYIIFITTHSGTAQTVAKAIDDKRLENCLGTIAARSVVMVVPRDVKKIKELDKEIKETLYVSFD